jgi:signal transduction histidine kinase
MSSQEEGAEMGQPDAERDRSTARLESLVAANRAIVAELSLDTLLRLIAETAREVLGAQYAALALIRPDGEVEQVIYSGVDEATLAALHELAQDSGPLSHLLTRPPSGPARLRPLAEEVPLTQMPSTQPLVRSLLAVAVRTSTHVYGNLYLGNRVGAAEFIEEDKDLVVALAATAGIAIENARLYEESHRRQQWLHASAEISQRLLSGGDSATVALRSIAEFVQQLAPADTVSLVVSVAGEPDLLEVAVAAGQGAEQLQGMRYHIHHSVAWQAMQSRHGLVLADADRREGIYLHVREVIPARQVMAIPLQGEAAVHGAIVVVRTNSVPFSESDLEMAEDFANQATLALELAEARQDRHRLALLEDRARIARDLHDHVVQKLFAVGLTLQGVARSIPDPALRERLSGTIAEIDDTIRSIRTAIFQLQEPRSPRTSARSRVRSVLADLTPTLGFGPIAQFEGPVDTMVDEALAAEVEAVLRASLGDIAAHAGARAVTVNLRTDGSSLRTTVTDDGAGSSQAGSCLAELRRRAERRGGQLELERTADGGLLRWTVPV